MNTILIATDFSKASRNASLYGLQLAKAINANIILFTAYQVPNPPGALNVSISRYDIMKQTGQKLEDEAKRIAYINMPRLKTICDEGVAGNSIIDIANEKKADLIIAGMKGSGKNLKKIFGSTATSLAKNSNIPVIIVPEDAKFKNPKSIIFASDSNLASEKDIPELLTEIIQLFKSKLYVVKVIKNEERFEVFDALQKTKKSVQMPGILFKYPVGTDITYVLTKFIDKHNADMVVMMPHKHAWMERFFRKSETKEMIFHTRIPLLIVPETSSEKHQLKYFQNESVAY